MPPRTKLTLPGAIGALALLALLALVEGRGGWLQDLIGGAGGTSEAATRRGDDAPGAFDYYALVLSWSPTHCASEEGSDDELQCARRDGRRYAFVLHGLWPQYERGYPENCPVGGRVWVPPEVIDGMLDIMPSKRLVIHEYRKHGTCSGLSAEAYFSLSRKLFEKITLPRRFTNPFETQFLSPDDLEEEFIAANPGLTEDMIAVSCGGPGSRLREIRICVGKSGGFRPCGENEEQSRLCRSRQMAVPPVRSSR